MWLFLSSAPSLLWQVSEGPTGTLTKLKPLSETSVLSWQSALKLGVCQHACQGSWCVQGPGVNLCEGGGASQPVRPPSNPQSIHLAFWGHEAPTFSDIFFLRLYPKNQPLFHLSPHAFSPIHTFSFYIVAHKPNVLFLNFLHKCLAQQPMGQ